MVEKRKEEIKRGGRDSRSLTFFGGGRRGVWFFLDIIDISRTFTPTPHIYLSNPPQPGVPGDIFPVS